MSGTPDPVPTPPDDLLAQVTARLVNLEKRQDKDESEKKEERYYRKMAVWVSVGSALIALVGIMSNYWLRAEPDANLKAVFRVVPQAKKAERDRLNFPIVARLRNEGVAITIERIVLETQSATEPATIITLFSARVGLEGSVEAEYKTPPDIVLPYKLEKNEGVLVGTVIRGDFAGGTVVVFTTTGKRFPFIVPKQPDPFEYEQAVADMNAIMKKYPLADYTNNTTVSDSYYQRPLDFKNPLRKPNP